MRADQPRFLAALDGLPRTVCHLDLHALFDTTLAGYVEGLADAGWRISPDLVRLGMSATLAAKYAWIGPAVLRAAVEEKEMLNRRPFDDTLRWWAPTVEFLLRQTSQARDLLRRAGG